MPEDKLHKCYIWHIVTLVKRRKISELCTDTRYELLIDEIDGFYQKEKAQIIKLPITDQSHR